MRELDEVCEGPNLDAQTARLRWAMKVAGFAFLLLPLAFPIILFDLPLVHEGHAGADATRWDPQNKSYELMITAIYAVWGVMLWRASSNPLESKTFIDFTIWANVAHVGVMLAIAALAANEHLHLVTDVLILAAVTLVLATARPRPWPKAPQCD